MTAARTGNLETVRALLAKGANPNAKERNEQTALMWAAAEGHTAIAQALIASGADIRATLVSGFTPLFFAVREGHIDVTRALLKAGIDVNETLHGPEGPQKESNNASYKPVPQGDQPAADGRAERPLRARGRTGRRRAPTRTIAGPDSLRCTR